MDLTAGCAGQDRRRDERRGHVVNPAGAPSKVTLVAPVRSVPRIFTAAPTLPDAGSVLTNGPRPTESLKTVPQPKRQEVVLARNPVMSCHRMQPTWSHRGRRRFPG